MSRRRQPDPRDRREPSPAAPPPTPRQTRGSPAPPAPSALTAYRALLPLRFFLGGMFLYAGLDKLVDPAFLHATGVASVGAQLDAYVRVSPLAPLIQILAQPWPVAIGLLIALAEIAVGIGTLTGILYRWSAALGAALAGLFFLTASWNVRPIYFGPDLPYMFGWITLSLAGSGGLYVLEDRLLARLRGLPLPAVVADDGTPRSAGRRAILEAGVLGLTAVFAALVARGLGRLLGPVFTQHPVAGLPTPAPSASTGAGALGDASAAPAGSAAPGGSAAPAATAAVAGIANTKDVPKGSAVDFQLPNGDPGILVKLRDGEVVAYDGTCTHQGCPVGFDRPSGLLFCPCHGATFDPAQDAAVMGGPAPTPLASVPIVVDASTGEITLAG